MRYLGIDYGEKRVGLALSDETGAMGFPHGVVQNNAQLMEYVLSLIAAQNVGAVVIGAPHNLSGQDNPIAKASKVFVEELKTRSELPVFFEPEWFTTQEALRAPGGERSTKDSMNDARAAALILTSYLQKHGNHQ